MTARCGPWEVTLRQQVDSLGPELVGIRRHFASRWEEWAALSRDDAAQLLQCLARYFGVRLAKIEGMDWPPS